MSGRFCPSCGKEHSPHETFCANCGFRFLQQCAPPPPPVPPKKAGVPGGVIVFAVIAFTLLVGAIGFGVYKFFIEKPGLITVLAPKTAASAKVSVAPSANVPRITVKPPNLEPTSISTPEPIPTPSHEEPATTQQVGPTRKADYLYSFSEFFDLTEDEIIDLLGPANYREEVDTDYIKSVILVYDGFVLYLNPDFDLKCQSVMISTEDSPIWAYDVYIGMSREDAETYLSGYGFTNITTVDEGFVKYSPIVQADPPLDIYIAYDESGQKVVNIELSIWPE